MTDASSKDYLVNQQIKDFVFDLHDATRRSLLVDDVERLYAKEFKDCCDKYCDKAPWPTADSISDNCIGDDGAPDALFVRLYDEMAIRHLFAKLKPTLEDRIEAWNVYASLFEAIAATDISLVLTPQWVFDIMHEYVYQFQSFCQFKMQVSGRTAEDRAILEANPDAWSVTLVFERLHGLIAVSKLREEGATPPTDLHNMVGYFAIVTMSRLEILLGDYESAIDLLQLPCIQPFSETSLGARVFACRMTVLYHLGFALLMLKRYRDAICTFNSILSYLARVAKAGGGFSRYSASDQVQKNHDRMLALLAVAVALAPGVCVIDDAVLHNLKDKFSDKVALMSRGDVQAFHAMLTFACPKFVVPAEPSPFVTQHDAYRQQLDLFTVEVAHQQSLAKIRSYLKLYTSIGIDKLARFNDVTPEQFRAQLVGIKQKMRESSQPIEPFFAPVAAATQPRDIHFYVKGDMLHVDEPPKEHRHDDFFAAQILKYDQVIATVHQMNKK